jgi:hypothetical protein
MTENLWQDNVRDDGVRVEQDGDSWIIVLVGEAEPIRQCPCCDKPFASAINAKQLADYFCH